MDWKILDREEIKTRKLKELIKIIYFCLLIFFLLPLPVSATDTSFPKELTNYIEALEKQCAKYGWSDIKPREIPWEYYRTTQKKHPLIFVHFGDSGKNCVLFLGAVHGDETPTVYL
ncbi:MAG: hypothetical protein WA098_03895, partial [Smithella sp.]